jgi:radical SAM superfamily enzyme YgiQ (UPF0313 family)
VAEWDPDLVGLSIMTFQRHTARKVIALIRSLKPTARIVVGGYDPSLAPELWEAADSGVDYIVTGEGDITFRELVRALEAGCHEPAIDGLTYRKGDGFVRNRPRTVSHLGDEVKPPNRAARVLTNYTLLGRPIDIVETSRGCTYDCSFCSIVEMRGRNFHTWSFERVVDDIRDAKSRGARAVFLGDIDYIVQGMTSAFATAGDELGALMRRAGFRYVFLGIENILDQDLAFLRAKAKNAQREGGRTVGSATQRAVDLLHRHGMLVVGGLIVGNPGDTRESIDANLEFAKQYIDWPYIQHPTPYPGTPMTKDFREKDLIVNERVEEYDGTTAVVRTEHLEADEIEFMRWKAERWMKVRHFPTALRHDPVYVTRNSVKMMRHTFRGSTLRTWLGLETERDAFRRYKAIRAKEREFFPAAESVS